MKNAITLTIALATTLTLAASGMAFADVTKHIKKQNHKIGNNNSNHDHKTIKNGNGTKM